MSNVIKIIAVICAGSSFPLFIAGVIKLFKENVKDMEKRREEKRNITNALHQIHYGEREYSHEKDLVHQPE